MYIIMKNILFILVSILLLASCSLSEKNISVVGQELGRDTTIVFLKFDMPNSFLISVFIEPGLSASINKIPSNTLYLLSDIKAAQVYIPTTRRETRFLLIVTDLKSQKEIIIESKTK